MLERLLPRTPPPPPAPMEAELLQSPLLGLGEEDEADLTDWNLPLAFMKKRHCEKIEGSKSLAQSWRMKDRVSGPRAPSVSVLGNADAFLFRVPEPHGAG